jgi:hypothetical protein
MSFRVQQIRDAIVWLARSTTSDLSVMEEHVSTLSVSAGRMQAILRHLGCIKAVSSRNQSVS